MSISDLCRLKDAWQRENPLQARGGEFAITGFSFQFFQVLLASVHAWLKADPSDRTNPRVYGEFLSDIAEVRSDGVIVVTQVKYTQSSGMVSSALGDLFRIYRVAAACTPDLLGRLDLRILSARPDLRSVTNAIARWRPDATSHSDPLLADFRTRVEVELDADPEGELLALLANPLRAEHPLLTAHAWLGKLTAAAGTSGGYLSAAKHIWDDLTALDIARSKRKSPAVYVWKAADRPPSVVVRGSVLTGQQPQVHHLRQGYFSPRTELFIGIAERVGSWIAARHGGGDDTLRLPVYWIGGRSGAGKSVALLHVLALLHERGVATVLLPPSVAHLASTIRWSREMHRPGRPVVIALDDPYAPAAQSDAAAVWRDALEELHEVRQAGDGSWMPLLICCGPSEQGERLREDLPEDVTVLLDALPHERAADFSTLRDWYRERTGTEPPEVGDENLLLVQLFFEWRVGETLPEFARRFRTRILAIDQTGAMELALAQTLAVNRLYSGACRAAIEARLSADMLDRLDRLREESHLVDDPSASRPGLWLAHPHLAEAIYTSWFPVARSHVRREHLKSASLDWLRYGTTPLEQTSSLWAVSRVLGPAAVGSDVAHRLDEPSARTVLQEIYNDAAGNGQSIPLSHLPVWIELRRNLPGLSLLPEPVAEAISRLGRTVIEEIGLRLTCHKLLQHRSRFNMEEQEQIITSIVALLHRIPAWRGWLPVAEDAIERTADPRLWSVIAAWVEPRIRKPSAQLLLLQALRHANTEPRLTRIALAELSDSEATEEWARIAEHLIESSPLARADVLRWVDAHHQELPIAYLLGQLLQKGVAESQVWALTWAKTWHLEASANRVLEPLCAIAPTKDVIVWACAWIGRRHENSGYLMQRLIVDALDDDVRLLTLHWLEWTDATEAGWGFVWEALWKRLPGDEALATLAREWLTKAPAEHGSWGFVWEALWKQLPGDEALTTLARSWLTKVRAEHGSWGHVWKALWRAQRGDEHLATLAREWLTKVPEHHHWWASVWEALWKLRRGDDDLAMLAHEWLLKAPADQDGWWRPVWEALWKHQKGNETLATLARDRLSTLPANHGSWGFAWLDLWKQQPGVEALATLARKWLETVRADHGSWQYVWQPLWEQQTGDEELTNLAREWLAKAPIDHGSWHYVWEALWKHQPDDEVLVTLAREWLAKVPTDHSSWGFVWQGLRTRWPGDEALARLGRNWLVEVRADNDSWSFVWQESWKRDTGDENLDRLAREWLAQVPADHGSWLYVWESLWRHRPGDDATARLASGWLGSVSSDHRRWGYVWEALWKQLPGDQALSAVAFQWLATVPAIHGSWKYVWEALWKHQRGGEVLATLGREWLAKVPANHGSWGFVWQELWKHQGGNGALAALAHDWLASVPATHGSWTYVWIVLWKHQRGDQGLARLARKWLATVPASHRSRKQLWVALEAKGRPAGFHDPPPFVKVTQRRGRRSK